MLLVGLDEVGRGCWAGPLVAAAVALDPKKLIEGLNDSKKLTKLKRERLARQLHADALDIGIGWVWPEDIDTLGLTMAVKSAMEQSIQQISVDYTNIIIDGNYNFLPGYEGVRTLVRADGLIPEVSAASIVAKVARDRYMSDIAAMKYPVYGFEKHVGYGTAFHIQMLKQHGASPIHRLSYNPVQLLGHLRRPSS